MTTQTIWHACGLYADMNEGMNIIILTEPTENFVCCGHSQNVSTEVDVEFCEKNNIGYTRRMAGGTTVFLDENQIFYNIILYGYDFPVPLKALYKKALGGPIDFYKSLNINAILNNYNEISVEDRKIAGIGACSLEKTGIVVGNIILDFNYDLAVETLRFPSQNFKILFRKNLESFLTSIKNELNEEIPKDEIYDGLINAFEKNLDIKLVEDKLTNWENKKNIELEELYRTEKWLDRSPKASEEKKIFVKIKKGQFIFHFEPLETDFLIYDGIITEIRCLRDIDWVLKLNRVRIDEISERERISKELKKNLLKFQDIADS